MKGGGADRRAKAGRRTTGVYVVCLSVAVYLLSEGGVVVWLVSLWVNSLDFY